MAFFETNQYQNLKNSLNSYTQAEKNLKNKTNPDLYYNRGVVHSYLENYKESYDDFLNAHKIDEGLNAEELSKNILNTFMQTVKSIKNQCGLKYKKLNQIFNSIPKTLKDTEFSLMSISDFLDIDGNIIDNFNVKNRLISAKAVQSVTKVFEVPL